MASELSQEGQPNLLAEIDSEEFKSIIGGERRKIYSQISHFRWSFFTMRRWLFRNNPGDSQGKWHS